MHLGRKDSFAFCFRIAFLDILVKNHLSVLSQVCDVRSVPRRWFLALLFKYPEEAALFRAEAQRRHSRKLQATAPGQRSRSQVGGAAAGTSLAVQCWL